MDRRTLRRAELTTLRADLDACADQVARLQRQVQQLSQTVTDLREKIKS